MNDEFPTCDLCEDFNSQYCNRWGKPVSGRISICLDEFCKSQRRIAEKIKDSRPNDSIVTIEHRGNTTIARCNGHIGVAHHDPAGKYNMIAEDMLALQRLYEHSRLKKIIDRDGNEYGIIGTPTKFSDSETGETLCVGDFVKVVPKHKYGKSKITYYSVIVHAIEYGDFVAGFAADGVRIFATITKTPDGRALREFNLKIVPADSK